ncbi:hypothetical protein KM043_007890 [Ampulex compressa]|nr:hypothetical protein KM043_007890 [Ampulex compressa]
MDIFERRYYRQSKYLMTVIGQWPYSNSRLRFCVRTVFVIFGITLCSLQIVSSGFTMELAVRTAAPMIALVLVTIRYIFYWINMDMIKKLLDHIKSDWGSLKTENELEVIERYADKGRELGTYYVASSITVYVSVIVLPFVPRVLDVVLPLNQSRPYIFIYDVDYIIDRDKYYYLISLIVDIVFIAGILVIVGADLTLLYCVTHASGSLGVVGYCFEHMFDTADYEIDEEEKTEALFQQISYSVQRHIKAAEYIKLLISSYVGFMLIQLLCAVATLTVFFFQAAKSLKAGDDLSVVIMAIGNAVTDWCCIFAYIYPAQKVMDCSSELLYQAYNGRWYAAPLKVQKLLLPILRRSLTGHSLSVFGILTASMELFAAIIRTSMSYFTLLCTLQQ